MKALRFVILCLLVIFLLDILTVESHEAAKGSFRNRLPTCVEGTVAFALNSSPAGPFQPFPLVGHFLGTANAEDIRQSVIFFDHGNRAPPLFL